MSTSEKEVLLQDLFNSMLKIDEKDKSSILAYIQGTIDTRERLKMEKNN